MDVQVVDWFGEGELEPSCHCSPLSPLFKAKAATGHPSLNPDTASTQHFIKTWLSAGVEERNSSAREGQKAEQEEGFLRKGTELTSGQIAQHFSISMCMLTSSHCMGGFILTEWLSAWRCQERNLCTKSQECSLFLEYFWDNILRKPCGKLRGSKH